MPNHLPPPKSPCGHKIYGLSCNDYDRLVEHARGVCQICGVSPEKTGHGFLVVDHDAKLGQWAVRGMLCSDCNSALPCGSSPQWAQEYLAAPWWRHEVESRGIEILEVPEPPIGSEVVVPLRNRLRRTRRGWEHLAKYGGSPRTWEQLSRRYGPHNIRVVRLAKASAEPAQAQPDA